MIVLTGYDNRSVVLDSGEYILRNIDAEYFNEIARIYDIYQKRHLEKYGIVSTEIDRTSKSFHHEKHIISYPYEWTANMYKDAVLFHLGLIARLHGFGLTLKDALPSNIVFNNCKPVFVDFSSLVDTDKLVNEEWLVAVTCDGDPRCVVVDQMFTPFMLIPLMAFAQKNNIWARRLLSDKACNCKGGTPSWKHLLHDKKSIVTTTKNLLLYACGRHNCFVSVSRQCKFYSQLCAVRGLLGKKLAMEFINFNNKMTELVAGLDVTPSKSAYLDYYKNKKENFSFDDCSGWNNKQVNLQKILLKYSPRKVLDIGANTGWYSILAANHGATVIATEIDESSIDSLYLYAKVNNQPILPLCVSFDGLTREIFGVEYPDYIYQARDYKNTPLFLPATQRLQADLVLCLGLLHHLVLGMGKKIGDVIEVLAKLTTGQLVLEFISFDDKLICDEPSFFKSINTFSKDTYNLALVIDEGKRFFKSMQTMDSSDTTRTLLLFEK